MVVFGRRSRFDWSNSGSGTKQVWFACSVGTTVTKRFFYTPEAQTQHLKCYLDHSCEHWTKDSGEQSEPGPSSNNVYVVDATKKRVWIRQPNGEWLSAAPNPEFSASGDEIWLRREDSISHRANGKDIKNYTHENIDLRRGKYSLWMTEWNSSSNRDDETETRGAGSCVWITPLTNSTRASPTAAAATQPSPEATAFDDAARVHSSATYRAYLARFPNGKHAGEIKRRLSRCKVIERQGVIPREEPVEASAFGVAEHDVSPIKENSEELRGECQKSHGGTLDAIHNNYHDFDFQDHTLTITTKSICHWRESSEEQAEECP